MTRIAVIVGLLVIIATGCGGDKQAPPTVAPSATAAVTATSPAPAAAATVRSAPTPSAERALGGIFGSLFSSGAFGAAAGGTGPAGLAAGDPRLLDYVLSESELPAGFGHYTHFSSRVPDGLSRGNTVDIAASIGTRGDPSARNPTDISVLMSMAIKPKDLQDLGASFEAAKGLTDEDLKDAVGQSAGGFGGFGLTEAHILDVPELGDGAFGMSMAIDLGALAGAFGADAGSGAAPVLRMRVYVFAEGDYAGGIVRVGFGDALDGEAEDLALARVVDAKLKDAP